MKALVYRGPGEIRCESVPDPSPPGADGVVVRIDQATICGSDLHVYHGHLDPTAGYTVGHECVGEVMETGSAVRGFRSGDRVLVSGVTGCSGCPECRRGQVTRCLQGGGRVFGTNQGLEGGQAEALAVPHADVNLCAVPEGLSPERAVLLTDILPTGYLGVRNAELRPGQDVAIVGLGPVGLMALLCARLHGPARIFALDSVPERLARAEALGAIPCAVGDGIEPVLAATGGAGVHAVIEAVGSDAAIQTSLGLVRRGGTVSVVGVNVNPAFPFPMGLALMKGITFRIGVCPIPAFWGDLMPLLLEDRLQPEFLFTHRIGLSEGADAYALFDQRRDGVLKILLDPSA